ncbi:MAG: 4'-phosphopantetheinyl transferase superfamily protein [bacterium]|nr:4'-phosphopantetheinyl transferase superfamily protein [bacterium]
MEIIAVNIKNKIKYLDDLYKYLSENETAYCLKYRQDIDKLRAAVSCLLKKYIIDFKYNSETPEIEYNSFKKPYFSDYPGVKFNLSHSGDWVVAAVSEYEVGIDCEIMKKLDSFLDIAKNYYSREEYVYLLEGESSFAQISRFYDIWTKKESFIKAVGKGLSLPLTSFTVPFEKTDCIAYTDKLWHVESLNIDDGTHKAAVCSEVIIKYNIKYYDVFDLIKT